MPEKTKSSILRKYQAVYDEHMKKIQQTETIPRKCKNTKYEKLKKDPENHTKSKKSHIKPMTDYQKFVKLESKKSKYNGMTASERMKHISKAWKNKNV